LRAAELRPKDKEANPAYELNIAKAQQRANELRLERQVSARPPMVGDRTCSAPPSGA